MQSGVKQRIVRIARERMERECACDFALLRTFGTPMTRRFLSWIGQVAPGKRLEAALSVTYRQLGLMHLGRTSSPECERWSESFLAFPLNAGLNPDWKPRSHSGGLTTLIKNSLGPFKVLGPASFEIPEGNFLFLNELRTVIELNTKFSDIALYQFVREGPRQLDISYLGLLGMGQTGWLFGSDEDLQPRISAVQDVISKAKEVAAALG